MHSLRGLSKAEDHTSYTVRVWLIKDWRSQLVHSAHVAYQRLTIRDSALCLCGFSKAEDQRLCTLCAANQRPSAIMVKRATGNNGFSERKVPRTGPAMVLGTYCGALCHL